MLCQECRRMLVYQLAALKTMEEKGFIDALSKKTKVVLVHFGNPYALKYSRKAFYATSSYSSLWFTNIVLDSVSQFTIYPRSSMNRG